MDKPNWAFDYYAKQIAKELESEFEFHLKYVVENPVVDKNEYDLIWVYFWGEELYSYYGFQSDQIIKFVSSHRWEDPEDKNYPTLTPHQFARRYLRDASSVACVSMRLFEEVKESHPHVYVTRNGYDKKMFYNLNRRSGEMKLGWVGNITDPVKGYHDILMPPIQKHGFKLNTASGNVTREQINGFYNDIDIILVSSRNEGEPLTLIEGMAAGCFPVCTNVGLTTELIKNYDNGIIVDERTPEAFEKALIWCNQNIDVVRAKGKQNAQLMRDSRGWEIFIPYFRRCFNETLERKNAPKFRNDDISFDTDLGNLKKFCELFWQNGYSQIHGVTVYGNSNTLYKYGEDAVEYEGHPSVAKLENEEIINLSKDKDFRKRKDIVQFLNASKDEVALHGLYHTDYSKMSEKEQRQHIEEGLKILDELFPDKIVRYFIAPFNRTNESLYKVCREMKLEVLAASGVHLEDELEKVVIKKGNSYRYHHHRFYPESKFDYYDLSLDKLSKALSRK
ncbi:MAG: glycosyltransferase [Candidatus Doudnabacteria bacterium]|nr:glycosyltransferase [Candidatus Doudnabacteria bacterium]